MRIYVPTTTTGLRALLDGGELGAAPLTGFAVTPGLREWYVDDDLEELEYAALSDAARASLRLIDADSGAAARRVVVAADVDGSAVEIRDDLDRGVIRTLTTVPMAAVASVHVDDADAEAVVRAAAEAVVAADLGDDAAQERVDDAEGFELSWYANQEIAALLDSL
ncbi:hypothetical protein [Jatrophihabitans endophyticus]|uniref:DUF6912 family protein n=1 Tax=Jatrophihabitans endophyticus TaxID=1206085 RepID=UPI0019F1460E|nr:hypothetical protein [Jatrophihabitans endophyticus]MBE7187834.1 hypothetical protein [Jatrophihabitans endophyticus]